MLWICLSVCEIEKVISYNNIMFVNIDVVDR